MADEMLTPRDLVEALPGLSGLILSEPKVVNWGYIATELETDLPRDFKELSLKFSAFEVGGFLRVWIPDAGYEDAYVEGIRYELETISYLVDDQASGGYAPYPNEGGLLPWGQSLDGDLFCWQTRDLDPNSWTVVIGGANGTWWEVEAGLLEFLVGLINGTFDTGELPPNVIVSESSVVSLVK
ncbi:MULTISPECIES: hypothetical protein [Streptomyces]|uniref:hypothetical protein n=1 Tax=Streptomyces TaxID=1883 RepID=UPI0012FEAB44|nr:MULTISPECIES: hypothetical protein [Streptomyces]